MGASDCRLPRTRGDGPAEARRRSTASMASPHTRGWTRQESVAAPPGRGFPAHAGMDPSPRGWTLPPARLPRTRGDGPDRRAAPRAVPRASPHTRGWTLPPRHQSSASCGFPAHAGMDPGASACASCPPRLPRTRGDGPVPDPRRRSLTPASPHTRGWTITRNGAMPCARGFPAHAGMDPGSAVRLVPCAGLPRTRGDGPPRREGPGAPPPASPHTRGWTVRERDPRAERQGFPAHAGMDRGRPSPAWRAPWLPRTRGDGPLASRFTGGAAAASPHTRGWTLRALPGLRPPGGFPAHAGMDPARGSAPCAGARLPRTRGDGPVAQLLPTSSATASPHTRGWTLDAAAAARRGRGFLVRRQ